jgi:hypothetical protein
MLRARIIRERQQREVFLREGARGFISEMLALIAKGARQQVLEYLLFFATPASFVANLSSLRQAIEQNFKAANEAQQIDYLRFLANLALCLRSFLPKWNLQNRDRYGEAALRDEQIETEASKTQALAATMAAKVPTVGEALLVEWRAETVARLKAEKGSHPEAEAAILVGNSVDAYLNNLSIELKGSHLRRIAEMRNAGQTRTEVSNDYAAFLQYALYIGASFATINPPLVDMAWVADRRRWDPVVDSILVANPDADADALARLVTTEIVLANMCLLRPIFLLTEGRMGCVCLQVNPYKHGEAEAMISHALLIYDQLQARLDGGVPNVVFKLPGTRAGLEACRALTAQGIGVTITVNFGLFQHLPFAEAIQAGQSIFSCLVEMNGRLAYPVRDELLAGLDQLADYGIDEATAREAAAWAGILVLKRLYKLLIGRGYDLERVKPLVASLRMYEGDSYEYLPSAFPDITESLGASIISVFPNIRRAFDRWPEMVLEPCRIEASVAEPILKVLRHSEIFKQAYYVGNTDWSEEDDDFRPDYPLALEDEVGTAAWTPVHNTLTEFCESYDTFTERILERKEMLLGA